MRPGSRLLSLLAMLLTACAPTPERPAPVVQPTASAPAPTAARGFLLDAAESEVLVLVYRGGRLARFGHNHVIRLGDLQGRLDLADPLVGSRLALSFASAAMELDNPELRAEQGAGFESPLRPADIAATRRNLLGPALLDAAHHPRVQVRGQVLGGQPPSLNMQLTFQVRGHSSRLRLPLQVELDDGLLWAEGELELLQTDLGLTPFSLLMGALTVENRMLVKYRLVMRAEG
jgi:hypothetical protein